MTTYKIRSLADLVACFDEVAEQKLQDTARLLSRHGATDEEIDAAIWEQRKAMAEARAQCLAHGKAIMLTGEAAVQ